MKRIDRHPPESDEESAPESILDTEHWHDWNGDLDNPYDSEDNWEADNEFAIDLDDGVENAETPEHWDVSAAPSDPRLIWPTRRSMNKAEQLLQTINAMEPRRNTRNKKT